MILTIILFPVICLVFYLLYISGWLLFSAKIAAVFTGYIRRDGNADLHFVSCRGQVRRVIRFPDEGTYEMNFHSEIRQGKMIMKLCDTQKRKLIMCQDAISKADINVERGKRYCIIFQFYNATGQCRVEWRKKSCEKV